MQPKAGIIIPSYNQGKYIERALVSAIDNKKHADIEIAVMDGGSQDETVSVIKKYEAELRVWRSEADRGQADAINKGIEALPDCKYYLWLNSDDRYESEYAIQHMISFAENSGYQVCYGLSHFIDEQDREIGEYPVEPFSRQALGKRCYLSQPSVMFSREAYKNTGLINVNLKMCLDYEYWIRLAQKYDFGLVREYIGSTRMYGDTKTSTMQRRHLEEAMGILMKYYGDVPMQWIVARALSEDASGIWKNVPKRLLMLLFRPLKKRIIKNALEGIAND